MGLKNFNYLRKLKKITDWVFEALFNFNKTNECYFIKEKVLIYPS